MPIGSGDLIGGQSHEAQGEHRPSHRLNQPSRLDGTAPGSDAGIDLLSFGVGPTLGLHGPPSADHGRL